MTKIKFFEFIIRIFETDFKSHKTMFNSFRNLKEGEFANFGDDRKRGHYEGENPASIFESKKNDRWANHANQGHSNAKWENIRK